MSLFTGKSAGLSINCKISVDAMPQWNNCVSVCVGVHDWEYNNVRMCESVIV